MFGYLYKLTGIFLRYLATASSDNTVKIWNVDGFTLEKTLTGEKTFRILN